MPKNLLLIFLLVIFDLIYGQKPVNLLCIENGARVIGFSSSDWNDFKAYFDSNEDTETSIYCSARHVPFPHSFIYELALTAEISALEFDTEVEETAFPGVSAKDVRIYAAPTDQDTFQFVQSLTLEQNMIEQLFEVYPFQARRIKIEILSNYGQKLFTELARVKAFGYFLPFATADSLTGTWITTFGEMTITRTQPFVTGCYNEGMLQGTFDNRVFSFYWTESDQAGIVSAILNEEGNLLIGFWGDEDQNYEAWYGEITTRSTQACPENPLTAQLKSVGETLIFKSAPEAPSDTSYSSAKSLLFGAVRYLIENPDKKLAIESFMDGGDEESINKALAELWALRVKDYFLAYGIAAHRLTIKGISEARPLADSQTITGKNLNQRIRLRVQ